MIERTFPEHCEIFCEIMLIPLVLPVLARPRISPGLFIRLSLSDLHHTATITWPSDMTAEFGKLS